MSRKERPEEKLDPATKAFFAGSKLVAEHPLFHGLRHLVRIVREKDNYCPPNGWAVVLEDGQIHVHPTRRGDPQEWAYVLAHGLLHLGFDHFNVYEKSLSWNATCDAEVEKFLGDLRFGRRPEDMVAGTAGTQCGDMFWSTKPLSKFQRTEYTKLFAHGLVASVRSAVRVAGGYEEKLGASEESFSNAEQARRWFINTYPLLGALAATFKLIENGPLCERLDISVAAVNEERKELYVNPGIGLTLREAKFVMAHELLHVGLRHDSRRRGRDPHLWNVACDYVINGWLVEMGIGDIPKFGGLYDPELKGLSADAVYDRLVVDLRRHRKLATFAGIGACDMIEATPDWLGSTDAISLDDFYRRALAQGLTYHNQQGRGTLPAALLEEIRALDRPPIPWDVELAQWFDLHFSPLERVRSYARLSRRQSSTPDIPRPRYMAPPDDSARTFGIVLDTSGSMNHKLLAKCLGTIASYCAARDVRRVRLVYCDAAAYDQGYVAAEEIGDRVEVKGRGGTVLQPGIDLLEKAEDFPKNGPILVMTDGECDDLRITREHAFLLPEGKWLPFLAKGKVFRVS